MLDFSPFGHRTSFLSKAKNLYHLRLWDASLRSSMTLFAVFLRCLVAALARHDNGGVFTYLSLPLAPSGHRPLVAAPSMTGALFLRSLVAALCRDDSASVFTYLSFRYVVRRVVEGFARKNLLLCGCCRCFTSFQHDRCAILLNLYWTQVKFRLFLADIGKK